MAWIIGGIVLLAIGGVGFLLGVKQKKKLALVEKVPTKKISQLLQEGDQVAEVKGKAISSSPLESFRMRKQCVWYHYVKEERVKDEESYTWKKVDERTEGVDFAIDDGTGKLWVKSPQDLPIDGDLIYDQEERERVKRLVFKHTEVYRIKEWILPQNAIVYALGMIKKQQDQLVLEKGKPFILSTKKEAEIKKHASRGAILGKIIGWIFLVIAIIVIILGLARL